MGAFRIGVSAVTLKLKYASAAFVVVLLAMVALAALFAWQDDLETRRLSSVAESSLRERVATELSARASETAEHAADAVASAVASRDAAGLSRHLQEFIDDSTVTEIGVTDTAGVILFSWKRSDQVDKGVLRSEATAPVREMVETIPGAATPHTFGQLRLVLEQAAPPSSATLTDRLAFAKNAQLQDTLLLAGALALLGGLLGAGLAWRAARKLERPIVTLIRGVERIGQGDYTRPLEVRRRDEIGELQQALEKMRGRLRQGTINKNYLHSVLNSMTDAVFVTSPDGVIKVANSAACKLLQYGEEEILGRGIAAVLDEREREGFDLLQAAQETRETLVRTRTGQTIPVSLTGSHIASDDPQFQGSIFVARNITDRKIGRASCRERV